MFNWLDAVDNQAPELLGRSLLYPKFSEADINAFGIKVPSLFTGIFPEGPVITQYFL